MNSFVFVQSDIEFKELQFSEDQNQATKPDLSLITSEDHHKQLRSKAVKMKTKLRAAPYPEVGLHLVYSQHEKMNGFRNFVEKC